MPLCAVSEFDAYPGSLPIPILTEYAQHGLDTFGWDTLALMWLPS